jgi:GMP synthase-like glutamine amidotransferase
MTHIKAKTGILIINTSLPGENLIGPSERNLSLLIGKTANVRVLSALDDLSKYEIHETGIILNGSPHSVTDDLEWLDSYREFIIRMIGENKLILGICFGLHMLAEIYGGTVEKAPEAQVGYEEVRLTGNGSSHPLFAGISDKAKFPTFHYFHALNLPTALTLASTGTSDHYAIDFNNIGRAPNWGVQFHPEMDVSRLQQLCEENRKQLPDWQERIARAKQSEFGSSGATLIQNYVNAVHSHEGTLDNA